MSNNPALYNAIINGITSGSQNRWTIPSSGGGDFTIFRTIVTVVASEVDEAIGPADLNISQISLMESICQGYFQNNSVENIRHTLPDVVQYIVSTYNSVSAILDPVETAGEEPFIAPGDFPGQPAYWNGSQWAPLPISQGLALDTLAGVSEDSFTGFTLNGEENFLGLATGANPSTVSQPNQLLLANFNPSDTDEYNSIAVGQNDLRITERINSGTDITEYIMAEHSHIFKTGIFKFLELSYDSGIQKIGFFGATPVARPVITGGTSQQIMDSLITALTALGLVTDGR